jgi:glutathione S-transferase
MIVLNMIGVEYSKKLLVFTRGEHKSPEFLKLNPAGKIPVLQVNDQSIAQNSAILMWLADAFPTAGVLPKTNDPMSKAALHAQLLRFSADLHPIVTRIRMPQFFCDTKEGPARVKELGEQALEMQMQDYEQRLQSSNWLHGDQFSALDAYLHWVWFRVTGAGFDANKFPAIESFYQRSLELEFVKDALDTEAKGQQWLEENGLAFKMPN